MESPNKPMCSLVLTNVERSTLRVQDRGYAEYQKLSSTQCTHLLEKWLLNLQGSGSGTYNEKPPNTKALLKKTSWSVSHKEVQFAGIQRPSSLLPKSLNVVVVLMVQAVNQAKADVTLRHSPSLQGNLLGRPTYFCLHILLTRICCGIHLAAREAFSNATQCMWHTQKIPYSVTEVENVGEDSSLVQYS